MDFYQAKKEFEASQQRMYAEGQLTAKEAFAAGQSCRSVSRKLAGSSKPPNSR